MSEEVKMVDNVNHPKHYEGNTSLECIECMELIFGTDYTCAFCLENAFKYLWRHEHKNNNEDVNKADWYLSYVENKQEYLVAHGDTLCYDLLEKLPMLRVLYNKAKKKYEK